MRTFLIFISITITLMLSAQVGKAESECTYAGDRLVEGKPIVWVSPVYPSKALRKGIEGCVVVAYALKPAGGEKTGLIPHDATVIESTEQESRAFEKAALKALQKYYFSPITHQVSEQQTYFSIIVFETHDNR